MNSRSFLLILLAAGFVHSQDCTQRTADDFVPMSLSERLANMENSAAGPRAFLAVGVRAGIDEGANRQREWRQGAQGYGLRLGSAYAEHFIGQVFEQSIAFKLHEDNRYFASGRSGFAPRVEYALSSAILARHDDGSRHVSISGIAGAAGGAFVASAWQPRSTASAGDAAVSFGLTMGIRAGLNLAREFAPRFLHPILH